MRKANKVLTKVMFWAVSVMTLESKYQGALILLMQIRRKPENKKAILDALFSISNLSNCFWKKR